MTPRELRERASELRLQVAVEQSNKTRWLPYNMRQRERLEEAAKLEAKANKGEQDGYI